MKNQRGFTLVEIILVMTIFVFMTGFITLNLVNAQRTTSINAEVSQLNSDLREQQIKAMVGDTEGRGAADTYGIHFDTGSYTLFHGIYSVNATDNLVVNLDNSLQFTTAGLNVVFARVSGEIGSSASISIKDSTNNVTKTLQLNIYGVVTQVN